MDGKLRTRSNWALTIFLLCCSLTVLVPMYLAVVTALKDPTQSADSIWTLPSSWRWDNFAQAIEDTNFWQALRNSVLLTAAVVVCTVLTNSLVGYALARNMHRRGFKIAYLYIVSAMFIPFSILMLPLVKQMSILELDNIYGLVPLYVVYNLPFNTLVYCSYMGSIPREIDEAAYVDGANVWTTFWRVIFPLLMPANATVAILTGLATWNDFLLPVVMITERNQYTIPLTQYMFQGQFSTDYNLAFASYMMAMVPMLLVYLFAQRWIMKGVSAGAVKA